jgi:hypothetical protein
MDNKKSPFCQNGVWAALNKRSANSVAATGSDIPTEIVPLGA